MTDTRDELTTQKRPPVAAAVSGDRGVRLAATAYHHGMNRSGVLAALAAALIVAGLAFGFSGVSVTDGSSDVSCGSAFQPSDAGADMQNGAESVAATLVGATPSTTDYVAKCDDARQQRNTYALVGLGLGVVVGAIAMVAPGTKPREPVV